MTLSKEAKQEIIGKHGQGEADTGSAQVLSCAPRLLLAFDELAVPCDPVARIRRTASFPAPQRTTSATPSRE